MVEKTKKSVTDSLNNIHEKLRKSNTEEFVDVIIDDEDIKVSVGSRLKRESDLEDFIEVVVDLSSIESKDEVEYLDQIRNLIAELDKKGFERTSEQDGFISYEQTLHPQRIEEELNKIERSVDEKLKRCH